MRQCKGCGGKFYNGEKVCPYCGTSLITGKPADAKYETHSQFTQNHAQTNENSRPQDKGSYSFHNPREKHDNSNNPPPLNIFKSQRKHTIAQAVLATFFGSFGAQWFYRGQIAKGILCLCFSWTGIPGILGLVEGISLFVQLLNDNIYLP